jgi:hypothetical protein
MKSLAILFLTVAMPAMAAAADASDVEYTCDWSSDGKRWIVTGHNPYSYKVSCTISCVYKLADGKTYPAKCSGGLSAKTDGEICSNPVSSASSIVDDTDSDDASCE